MYQNNHFKIPCPFKAYLTEGSVTVCVVPVSDYQQRCCQLGMLEDTHLDLTTVASPPDTSLPELALRQSAERQNQGFSSSQLLGYQGLCKTDLYR